jgi:anti-sigma regulatory factor (Ser/Thr protein kinase)
VDVLLRQEVDQGIEVIGVVGPVESRDVAALQTAVRRAVELAPRGVLLDLSAASALAPEAVDVLNWMTARAGGWPRPVLAVCCASDDLSDLLLPAVQVHRSRDDAVRHVDDRPHEHACVRTTIPADVHAPRHARELARRAAADHDLPPDDLAVVVSELVTNAVRYGTPPVQLEIECCEDCVTVVVADAGPGRPARRDADDAAEGGRGLLLVGELARETGVRPQPPGKAVWAELPRRPAQP